jgi:hypothetical protein
MHPMPISINIMTLIFYMVLIYRVGFDREEHVLHMISFWIETGSCQTYWCNRSFCSLVFRQRFAHFTVMRMCLPVLPCIRTNAIWYVSHQLLGLSLHLEFCCRLFRLCNLERGLSVDAAVQQAVLTPYATVTHNRISNWVHTVLKSYRPGFTRIDPHRNPCQFLRIPWLRYGGKTFWVMLKFFCKDFNSVWISVLNQF